MASSTAPSPRVLPRRSMKASSTTRTASCFPATSPPTSSPPPPTCPPSKPTAPKRRPRTIRWASRGSAKAGRPDRRPPSRMPCWTRCARWASVTSICRLHPFGSGRRLRREESDLDHFSGHADRFDLEGDALFARPELAECAPGIALGQPIDELMVRIGDHVGQPPPDRGPPKRLTGIDEGQRDVTVPLHVLRPGAPAVAVQPEVAVVELKPGRVQLQRPVAPLGTDDGQDGLRHERPNGRVEDRDRVTAPSHRWTP